MTLEALLRLGRQGFRLEAGFDAAAGETVGLLGPSGAGKTTAVRLLAGALALDAGRIVLDGHVLDDGRTVVPPPQRRVGWVPQGGGLFPHLDAAANVAFPLRCRRVREAHARAAEWLERLGVGGRAGARVSQLSGGEARRVALARALATEPRLLLLDEPLTGLDVASRVEVRRAIREATAGTTTVLVAHDPVDALALADRVVVLEGGAVVQTGTPSDLCERPRTPYVAELAGLNLVRGKGAVEDGHPVVRSERGTLRLAEAVTGDVVAVFRPSAVALFRDPPAGSPRNVLAGTVAELAPTGERVRVRVDARPPLVAELTAEAAASLGLRVGEPVHAVVKATEIEVVPA